MYSNIDPDDAAKPITLPVRHNPTLEKIIDRVNADVELRQLWRCANINAVDRQGMSDHGEVHIRIVANGSLRLLRLLFDGGIEPSVVTNYQMTRADAEVVVVLAALLHDVGMSVHREDHERFSVVLAQPKLRELLDGIYAPEQRIIISSEVSHAIYAHHWDVPCLTIEAGAVKVGDTLDMTQGRSRIPFEAGKVNIHSVSAAAIDSVTIKKGELKPVGIEIAMSNSAGIYQLDELLRRKLKNSSIANYVEVTAKIEAEAEKRLITLYTF
ncbi:MAG: HD domain-containing protein [Chloroflexi bacterium]|nr:HD domain-containing protein [Chloroflexota bacterium]